MNDYEAECYWKSITHDLTISLAIGLHVEQIIKCQKINSLKNWAYVIDNVSFITAFVFSLHLCMMHIILSRTSFLVRRFN